jgi:hypothetical protein
MECWTRKAKDIRAVLLNERARTAPVWIVVSYSIIERHRDRSASFPNGPDELHDRFAAIGLSKSEYLQRRERARTLKICVMMRNRCETLARMLVAVRSPR